MRKILFFSFVFLSQFVTASSGKARPQTWIDGNGLEWTMLPVRTTYERAQSECHDLGFELPEVEDILEALDYGLTDPIKNPIFGCNTGSVDWIWSNQTYHAPTLMVHTVAKYKDTVLMYATDRYWGFCARYIH